MEKKELIKLYLQNVDKMFGYANMNAELTFKDNRKRSYRKTHSFADTSTRKHYPGTHSVTLIVNGAERSTLDFEVLAAK